MAIDEIWWWRLEGPDGAEVDTVAGRTEFPNRSDAESWVGETWAELAEQGVAQVTLFEGEREVYGPMGLTP